MDAFYAKPSASFGYYRGWPVYGGDGSGQGVEMAGANVFSAGQGSTQSGTNAWSPTILYLFVLVVIEMFIFGFIARRL